MHSKILILDFGSQVTQLIARRVRDAGVFSEVFPYDVSDQFVRDYGAAGVILSSEPLADVLPIHRREDDGAIITGFRSCSARTWACSRWTSSACATSR